MEELKQIQELIKQGRNIFITGGGGVGKSYLLNQLRQIYPNMVVTSTTGISAINVDGVTIHSWSGIGVCAQKPQVVIEKIRNNKKRKSSIRNTKLLAIDEISMLNGETLDYLDEVLSAVRQNPRKALGGIQLILFGDFFQLPPVEGKFAFESNTWKKLNLEIVTLTKVYRQTDTELVTHLNKIREGKIDNELIRYFATREGVIPDETVVRLYGTNDQVLSYNSKCFSKIQEEEHTFWSSDLIYVGNTSYKPSDSKLKSWDISTYNQFSDYCKYPRVINLKIGCRVMLLANLDIHKGLVNGSCGYVEEIEGTKITVKFDNGVTHVVKRDTVEYYKDGVLKCTRRQVPLKLAYASTIHKAQGMTFDKVYLDLSRIFDAGQTYVGLSRVKSLDGLYLNGFSPDKIKADSRVISFYNSEHTSNESEECTPVVSYPKPKSKLELYEQLMDKLDAMILDKNSHAYRLDDQNIYLTREFAIHKSNRGDRIPLDKFLKEKYDINVLELLYS